MGQESQLRRLAAGGSRKAKASPPILSHEFIIQNHGDIASCAIVLVFAAFMFQATSSIAAMFVSPQYNTTELLESAPSRVQYGTGAKDLATVAFYMICAVVVHAIIQEYALDGYKKECQNGQSAALQKLQRRLHLSKTKASKFTESGHLALFSLYSLAHAAYVVSKEQYLPDVSQLWSGYPEEHREMPFLQKMFFLVQLGYWLHQFPEFYLQKTKREEIKSRTAYTLLYLLYIGGAYALNFTRVALVILVLHYACEFGFHVCRMAHFADKPAVATRGFKAWNILFVVTRLGCITLAFLTFWYGLRANETQYVDLAAGNFNTTFVRLNSLLVVCGLQAYLMWNFIVFHLRQMRQRTAHTRKAASAHALRQKQREKERKEARKLEQEMRDLPEADQESARELRSRKAQ